MLRFGVAEMVQYDRTAQRKIVLSRPLPATLPRHSAHQEKQQGGILGSSTGVRNLTMPAAPAMPKARATELPMMTITMAPGHTCACIRSG